jgi:hypothetical protein
MVLPVIYTADEILEKGLKIVGFPLRRQQVNRMTQIERFVGHFGSKPVVYAEIWEALQTTAIEDARIDDKDLHIKYFFMTLAFLKSYLTESQLSGTYRIDEKTARTWVRFYIKKIQALKPSKVSVPNAKWFQIYVSSLNFHLPCCRYIFQLALIASLDSIALCLLMEPIVRLMSQHIQYIQKTQHTFHTKTSMLA